MQRHFTHWSDISRGMTLLELLVSISIIGAVTGVVLFNQQRFNAQTLLQSTADEIALTFREAQVSATAVKEDGMGSNDFSTGYGVFMQPSNRSVVLFADRDEDGAFDAGASGCTGECVKVFTIDPRVVIESIAVTSSNGNVKNEPSVHVSFTKKSLEAAILAGNGYGQSPCPGSDCVKAEILLAPTNSSATLQEKKVIILSTGHVYVE